MECLTGVTTYCSLHEESSFHFAQTSRDAAQLRWRFAWKDIFLGDSHVKEICKAPLVPIWDTDSLAHTLVPIYSEMFKKENFNAIFESVQKTRVKLVHYTRASFVALLKFVQRRHRTANWSELFNQIVILISKDSPASPKAQGAQELFLQLHLQRLHTEYVLRTALRSSSLYIPAS
jgi:hypothetical protein